MKGLYHLRNLIGEEWQNHLLDVINNQQEWNNSLQRRTQHYGYEYNYKNTSQLLPAPPLHPSLDYLRQQIESLNDVKEGTVFNQCIVNEYRKNQGIAPHIDHIRHFGPIIVSVSLGQPCDFIFTHKNRDEKEVVRLEPGDVCIMSEEARYDWKHSLRMPSSSKGSRVSITFREVRSK